MDRGRAKREEADGRKVNGRKRWELCVPVDGVAIKGGGAIGQKERKIYHREYGTRST